MSLHKFISIVIPALIAVLSLPAHTSAATAPDSIPDIELEGVVVTAPMREITVRGDTVIINAAAYKVREGAYLEELLRRVPGMEYDRETKTLTFNGRPLKEINVNGKKFFGSNILAALESLPADVVSKLKVYDKSSEEDSFLGRRSAMGNYVLDLSTAREINGTLMAYAEAGVGNNHKKEAALQASRFKSNGDNLSLTARSGNRNSTTDYRDNRNDNVWASFSKQHRRFSVNANFSLRNSIDGNEFTSASEQYLPQATNYLCLASDNVNKSFALSPNVDFGWEIDSLTLVRLEGGVGTSKNRSANDGRQATFDSDPGLSARDPFKEDAYGKVPLEYRVNESGISTLSRRGNDNYRLSFSLSRILNRHRSSLRFTADYSESEGHGKDFSLSSTRFYRLPASDGRDSLLYRNQYNESPSRDISRSVGLMFWQPLPKNFSVSLSYAFKYAKERRSRSAYDLSAFHDGAADMNIGFLPEGYQSAYIDSLSNFNRSRSIGHAIMAQLSYNPENWYVTAQMTVEPERRTLAQKSGLSHADTVRTATNFSPLFSASWQDGMKSLTFSYVGNSQQPSLSDLLSMTDNSNPLYVTHGNPDLKAAYRQDFNLEYRNYDSNAISASIGFSNICNKQAQAEVYDVNTGVRETYPVNVNGDRSMTLSVDYNVLLWRKLRLFSVVNAGYTRSVGLISDNDGSGASRSITRMRNCGATCRLSYNPSWGGFILGAIWRYSASRNEMREAAEHVGDYRFRLDSYADLPYGLRINNDFEYSFRSGTGIDRKADTQKLWNLGISWRFLKNSATLSAEWTDILSDRKAYRRYVSATGITESYSRQIGGYFMVTFRYQLSKTF